jgi:hypothetical protein
MRIEIDVSTPILRLFRTTVDLATGVQSLSRSG